MSRHIGLTSLALVLISVLVAATGYLRELVLARTFGAGTEMDAFYFSLAVVQATNDLLFGAALTASIVPILHRRETPEAGGAADPARFTVTVALTVGLLASVAAVVLRVALPYLIDALSPKMPAALRADCLALSTLLVWLLPLNALLNVGVLILNAHNRFVVAAIVYFFVNVIFVAVLVPLAPVTGFYGIAIASLAGPLLVLPIIGASLARMGLVHVLRPDFSKAFFSPLWRQSRPILLTFGIGSSAGLVMVAHLIIRGFAADSGSGSIAALGYAYRLYEVPLSLIANPAAVLMLPNIAILYKTGRTADIASVSRQMLLAGLVVLFPIALVTWAGADLIVQVLLERGNFGHEATELTARALRGFAPAIVGEGIIIVFYRALYAIHRPSRAVLVSVAALVCLFVCLLLFGRTALFDALLAAPLSLSISFLAGALLLTVLLAREIGREAVPDLPSLTKWVLCALIGLATWRIAAIVPVKTAWLNLATLAGILIAYAAAAFALFSDYRRVVGAAFAALRMRLR